MTKKIVITGGLGYIGTELCKIYSGISWNNEILVIDNRCFGFRLYGSYASRRNVSFNSKGCYFILLYPLFGCLAIYKFNRKNRPFANEYF